jgi:tetratricopeptide (TPR) repeat protein
MTLAETTAFHQVEMRLARYYLNKLRTACVAIQHGQAGSTYGLDLLDKEWRQIEHWQSHSAARSAEDKDWTRLCQAFPLAGLEVLATHQNLTDHARWLESGLTAALQLGNDRAELMVLDKLSQVYGLLGMPDKSSFYADRLLKRGRDLQDQLFIGRGYYHLGSVAEDRGSYHESLEYIQQALDIFRQLGARIDESLALYHLGSIALYLANFEKSHHYFSHHLKMVEAENNLSEVCRGLLSVAQVLLMLADYAQAEQYIRRSIRLSRQLGYQRLLGAGLIMLAQWYGEQDQLDLELKYSAEGIAVARSIGSQRDVIHGLSNSGLSRFLKGDFEGALSDLKEGLELAIQAGIPRFICNLQRNIADTYLALHDLEATRPALMETLRLAREMGSSYQMVKSLTSAIGYWQLKGWNHQAAIWAGSIMGRSEVDSHLFAPLCDRLEAALGTEAYHRAIGEGRTLELSEILASVLAQLSSSRS